MALVGVGVCGRREGGRGGRGEATHKEYSAGRGVGCKAMFTVVVVVGRWMRACFLCFVCCVGGWWDMSVMRSKEGGIIRPPPLPPSQASAPSLFPSLPL